MENAENIEEKLPNADADTTFEPTIDELVNDFDDEQTLETEEQLSALEHNNPLEEIKTLKEESEMPLEELLAKYASSALPATEEETTPPRKKIKKTSKKYLKATKLKDEKLSTGAQVNDEEKEHTDKSASVTNEQDAQENGNATDMIDSNKTHEETKESNTAQEQNSQLEEPQNEMNINDDAQLCSEKHKIRRSHLFELYPEQNFDNTVAAAEGMPLESLYSEDEDGEDAEEEEEEIDPDYIKKTIMVGSAFQAVIPGLSQYGDILPYENEDKLVWEPSQVSEAEVEEYLLKIREIKSTISDEERENLSGDKNENATLEVDTNELPSMNAPVTTAKPVEDVQKTEKTKAEDKPSAAPNSDVETISVVKDNEQALHLLVQCGYDFKEALRRKRLNAVPLTGGTMSIWSEEECQKFEEGIQKFGKDFLKIRQNQVRTRSMRELVHFYYLWKKSERRDLSFANADTVDHMDIYLNEGEDYGSSSGSCMPMGTTATTSSPNRKINGSTPNNFSIMTGGVGGSSGIGGAGQSLSPTKANGSGVNKKRLTNDATVNSFQSTSNVTTLFK